MWIPSASDLSPTTVKNIADLSIAHKTQVQSKNKVEKQQRQHQQSLPKTVTKALEEPEPEPEEIVEEIVEYEEEVELSGVVKSKS